jgi:hypothetical protein
MLETIFLCYEPIRGALLRMLSPFDIAKLLAALSSKLSPWERSTHMNILDEIFEDSSFVATASKLGMTVRIFGADLKTLEDRLHYPCQYLATETKDRPFYLFVLVTDLLAGTDTATLVREYRAEQERNLVPYDMDLGELCRNFEHSVAAEIAALSYWIFCAPHLSGSMPHAIPGWIPVFNARTHINVRAYISTSNDSNSRILYMDSSLIQKVFGYDSYAKLLSNLSNLETPCYMYRNLQRGNSQLYGKHIAGFIHSVLDITENNHSTENNNYIIANVMHSLNHSVILELL